MTTVVTRGAASAQALGYASSSAAVTYIEDVFSTYLYTGNGSTQTITNGIDLSGKGGLVWTKMRSEAFSHVLIDTARGGTGSCVLSSNLTNAAYAGNQTNLITPFNNNGYTIATNWAELNTTSYGGSYASWTFRKQPKFFDIVTYTGTGANRTIAHNLGSVPGAIWVKRTDVAANWQCYHRSLSNTEYMVLNSPDTVATNADRWNSTTPTSSVFSLGTSTTVNASGGTYVAYIFAHNAGGFGTSGTDNVISCGSYTGSGTTTGPLVNLGYEPQWIIVKRVGSQNWLMLDTMRYWTAGINGGFANGADLQASGPDAEGGVSTYAFPTSTGFQVYDNQINTGGVDFIYIAIRRGPMKVPTSGTSVFSPILSSAGLGTQLTTGFPVDLQMARNTGFTSVTFTMDRLRGVSSTATSTAKVLTTDTTSAEATDVTARNWNNTGFEEPNQFYGTASIFWNFRRAPGFFDVVCYTGTGTSNRSITHNLTVTPTLIILKNRTTFSFQWSVYVSNIFNVGGKYELVLNSNAAQYDINNTNDPFSTSTAPTSTQFTLGSGSACNSASSTYVAYLFATLAGVSKVGSYTGTGTTQVINCGFTAGARFVLIKRTDSTGDWYVWDSARGIVAGNDPFLLLNSTAAEDTSTDYVDTASSGFEISSTAPAAINANGGSFIFLAIA